MTGSGRTSSGISGAVEITTLEAGVDYESMASLSYVVVSVGDDGERKGISGSESLAGRVDEVGKTSRTGRYGRRLRDTETLGLLIWLRGKFYRLGVLVSGTLCWKLSFPTLTVDCVENGLEALNFQASASIRVYSG